MKFPGPDTGFQSLEERRKVQKCILPEAFQSHLSSTPAKIAEQSRDFVPVSMPLIRGASSGHGPNSLAETTRWWEEAKRDLYFPVFAEIYCSVDGYIRRIRLNEGGDVLWKQR